MIDIFSLDSLLEFSHSHCIAICAFLVPANLVATLQTMIMAKFHQPIPRLYLMAAIANFYAFLLIMHVVSWLIVGVVMAPTYILTFLGCVCIVINTGLVAWAIQANVWAERSLVRSGAID